MGLFDKLFGASPQVLPTSVRDLSTFEREVEKSDVPVIVEAVTDYVARRMIEREHALVATPAPEPEETPTPRRRGGWGMFLLGFILGAAALFGLAIYASLKNL